MRMHWIFAFTLAVALCPAFWAGPVQAKVLRMNSQFTATAAGSKIDQWFADEIKKATNGEVEIEIFWAGALGGPKENLTLLSSGAVDMAAMSPSYFPSELPFFSAPNSLPMTMETTRQAYVLMPRLLSEVPAFAREAARHDIRPLFFHLLNPYLLMSTEPIVSFDDLHGKKVRTWGEDLPRLFQAAGATPVNLLIPDIYEGLRHGMVDAIPFNVDLAVAYKTYETARHVSEVVVWMGPAWGVWINEDAWQKLTPAQQEAILEVADRATALELKTIDAAGEAARRFLVAEGVAFHAFPEEELRRWKAAAPDFYADWIARMAEQGKEADARETVEIMREVGATQ